MARFSNPRGQINSRRNQARQAWLNGIVTNARKSMTTVEIDERKSGITPQQFEAELSRRNLGFTKHKGKYHIVSLDKAA